MLTGRNARTNAGQLIATKVTVKSPAEGRTHKMIRGAKGKVSIRTYGKPLRVTVIHRAPATAEYLAYAKRSVYRVKP